MSLILITPPGELPLTLEEAKLHLRIEDDVTTEDALIERLIDAARAQVEDSHCWIQLVTASYELRMDRFPVYGPIVIPRPPLQSVESVKYIDTDGTEQTFSSAQYVVDAKSIHTPVRGEVLLAYGESWPSIRSEPNAVRVAFTCGFSPDASPSIPVPPVIKQWMLLQIGAMFENREAVAEQGIQPVALGFVDRLLDPWDAKRLA